MPWGRETGIVSAIIKRSGDYVLALKGNQGSLHEDAALWFADPGMAKARRIHTSVDAGHGRIEERTIPAGDAK